MVIQRICLLRLVLLAIVATSVTACGRSPTVKFYTLSKTQIEASGSGSDISIVVGPAEFPRVLTRNQIVTRSGANQFKVDEYHVWSAPLEMDFLRLVGDDVATGLGTEHISIYPAATPSKFDYRVSLRVMQFDGVLGESVTLRVRWVIAPQNGEVAAIGTFSETQPVAEGDEGYDGLVAAHSNVVGKLSKVLVTELQQLDKPAAE